MTTSTVTRPAGTLPLRLAVPLAAVGAGTAVLATHLAFAAAGADFVVQPPGQPEATVTAVQAAVVAAGVTLLGGLVAALLAARTRRPARLFVAAVVVVLVVMAVTPVLAADQLLTVVALEVEHLVAAAVALAVLLPPLRARGER